MFKGKNVVALFGLIVLFSMGIVAMAQEEDSITILADGDTVESFLSTEVQTRAYVFNGNEGDEVIVTMETTSDELDTFLVVIGGDGALLGSNDDFDSTSSSQVAAELPTTGSYIILASSYIFIDNILEFGGSDDEMEFTLRIEGNSEVEDLADGLDLTAEAIDGDSSFNGELDADVNAVYYVFTGAEGDIVNIAMEADDFNTAIHVFGPSGERVAFARADEETFNSSIEGLELPADGGYLIVATDIFFYNAVVEDENIPYTGGEFALEVSFE